MRANILSAILLFASTASPAQDMNGATISGPELSGYVIGRYQASLKDGDKSNSFEIRMARLSLSGHIFGDFEYRIQGQVNGNTETLGSSPRLIDAFAEWQKYGFFKVKAGQFKRPFTFENPMNPIDQGFMGNAQAVSKLSGSNDRTGACEQRPRHRHTNTRRPAARRFRPLPVALSGRRVQRTGNKYERR